jgi:hypothetical protein
MFGLGWGGQNRDENNDFDGGLRALEIGDTIIKDPTLGTSMVLVGWCLVDHF